MASHLSNNDDAPAETGTDAQIVDLIVGDEIEVIFEDTPQRILRATVRKILTDRDEGMGMVVDDYVACWIEIDVANLESEGTGSSLQTDAWKRTLTLCTDYTYSLDGRHVSLRKS